MVSGQADHSQFVKQTRLTIQLSLERLDNSTSREENHYEIGRGAGQRVRDFIISRYEAVNPKNFFAELKRCNVYKVVIGEM